MRDLESERVKECLHFFVHFYLLYLLKKNSDYNLFILESHFFFGNILLQNPCPISFDCLLSQHHKSLIIIFTSRTFFQCWACWHWLFTILKAISVSSSQVSFLLCCLCCLRKTFYKTFFPHCSQLLGLHMCDKLMHTGDTKSLNLCGWKHCKQNKTIFMWIFIIFLILHFK